MYKRRGFAVMDPRLGPAPAEGAGPFDLRFPVASDLQLKHGLAFEDLYRRDGLARLDAAFVAWLASSNAELHNHLVTARRDLDALDAKAHSQLLIDLAPHLEDFIGDLFGIDAEVRALQARHH